jgi:hypothetical protein
MRASVSIGVLASLVCLAASSRADPRYRVVLLKPPVTDDVTSDAMARVHGELTAAGFEVSVLAQDPALDVRSALETVARELEPIAAFAIVRAAGGNTAEIWVCDRMAGKSVIQSVRLDAAGPPGEPSRSVVLAVQAVELLKASLAQYWLASMRRSQPARQIPSAREPVPAAFAITGVAVEAGVGWMDSVGAVSAVWQPVVRASYGGTRGWAVRVTARGLGTDAAVQTPEGSAVIRQEIGAIEIVRAFRAGRRFQLVASIGAGAYHARVTGTGTGAQSHTDHVTSTWSALALAGAGIVVPIAAHVSFSADAQFGVTWPENLIRIVGVDAGRTGRPALLTSAGVLATF